MLGMNKAERLQYGDSLMTHAMVLTASHVEDEKRTVRWRVENSWGDADGDKGFNVMTDDWFSEFVYEIVIDKKHVPSEILDVLNQTPVVLPAWDPMGSLARNPHADNDAEL
ncbi:bleomycin hydrolase-like [Mizuhopecten yessoensis]|uniref:bleomycin hydrolase-like n=1 Tax=Mizuhopecten yessoensis TaxID=6573 RepID=UPI000B458238|nr:bleomycin hydrolase-like [Mizuhopecten yessoensis]